MKRLFCIVVLSILFFGFTLSNSGVYLSKKVQPIDRAEFHLTSSEVISLNDDGLTWVRVDNMVGVSMVNFSSSGGTLTKTAKDGVFLMNGVSDLSVNLACTIYYGLALNGSIVLDQVTPHTFAAPSKVANISITAIANIAKDDTIEIWAKGDGTNSVQITAEKLDVTFWGE